MDKPRTTIGERIIRASVIVGLAHILLKFAGLIQIKFATHYLNSTLYDSIIVVAFGNILNSLFLIGEEVIGPTFLTVFMNEKEQRDEPAAWRFTGATLTWQTLVLVIVILTIILFPDAYIRLCTSWRPDSALERYMLLRRSLQIIAPALLFLSLSSTTYVLLNGYKKFFLAAFGDTSTKICLVLGLVIGVKWLGLGYRAVLASILIGAVAKLATHLWGLRHQLHRLRPGLGLGSPAMKTMLTLMVPLLAGILFAKVRDVFNNVYVLSRLEASGILMANDLGRKLFASIQWLVPYSLQIALFPFLCELVSQDDRARLGDVVEKSWRMLVAVFTPAAVILAILSRLLAVGIFLGGQTGLQIALLAGLSTGCYVLVLPAAAVECVLMQGFFADRRTVSVTVIGILSSLLSVAVSFIAVVKLNVGAWQNGAAIALACVALGFVLSRWVKSLALTVYFHRCTPSFRPGPTVLFLIRVALLTLLAGAATWLVSRAVSGVLHDGVAAFALADATSDGTHDVSRLAILANICLSGSAGLLAFLAGARLLRLDEPLQMIRWALARLPGRRKAAA